jgi:hypothetical protein
LANPYIQDGWKIVQESNPINLEENLNKQSGGKKVTLGMLKSMGVIKN